MRWGEFLMNESMQTPETMNQGKNLGVQNDAPKRFQTSLMMHSYMQQRFKNVARKDGFRAENIPEFKVWKENLGNLLRDITGYNTMIPAPLTPKITEEVKFDDYLRQRVEIQTEPGVIMPLYVLIPHHISPPYPVILAPHGHGSGGKSAVAGCREDPIIAHAIDHFNYDYGLQFVLEGFITFCPDARGFGERQEFASKEDICSSSCQWINNMAIPLGQTVTGMWTWDLHRLIDYIETREDCDSTRIGSAGLSGGALQTLWAAALDDRIKCSILSGYFYGYKEALLDRYTNCSCNYVPHLFECIDMGDLGALIAPRPLLIESGTRDPLNGASGLENVKSQIKIAKRAYHLFNAEDALKNVVFDGEHRWDGKQSVKWMNQWLI